MQQNMFIFQSESSSRKSGGRVVPSWDKLYYLCILCYCLNKSRGLLKMSCDENYIWISPSFQIPYLFAISFFPWVFFFFFSHFLNLHFVVFFFKVQPISNQLSTISKKLPPKAYLSILDKCFCNYPH